MAQTDSGGVNAPGATGDLVVPQDAMQTFHTRLQAIVADFDAPSSPTQLDRVKLNTPIALTEFGNHADAQALFSAYAPVQDQLYRSLCVLAQQLEEMQGLFGNSTTSFDELERGITNILSQLSEPPQGGAT